jgi:hypothetical protein
VQINESVGKRYAPSASAPPRVLARRKFDTFDRLNFFDFDIFDALLSSPENSTSYGYASVACALPLSPARAKAMLKISIVDSSSQRRLVIEGKLVGPWASELAIVWRQATTGLNGRELMVDLRGLTAITDEGENVLLELMKEGASFRSCGVFTRQVLKRLARKIRRNPLEARHEGRRP